LDTPHSSVRAFAVVACRYWTAPGYRSVAWLLTIAMVLRFPGFWANLAANLQSRGKSGGS
jgi:hypothetical protein